MAHRATVNGRLDERAEANAAMVNRSHRALNQLLAVASDPAFKGTITITINAKDGVLAAPIASYTEHDAGKP